MHMRESNLRQLAHERIGAGQLPMHSGGGRVRSGRGRGEPCALCGAPVAFELVSCEVSSASGTRSRFRFHLACHTVWVIESIDQYTFSRTAGSALQQRFDGGLNAV
jgi:hypothetical protein